ncbi:MAG: HD domain-containing protein [bacterium]|nr:HD domain-containing protein [bacterium]
MAKELRLDLVERTPGGVLVFKLSGALGVEGSTGVQGLLKACVDEQLFRLILDIGEVSFISSAGMGAFLSIVGELREKGGDIVFVKMRDKIKGIFQSLDLLDFFNIVDSIDEAKTAFPTESERKPKRSSKTGATISPDKPAIDPRMTLMSLISGFTDIIESASTFDDKVEKLLEIAATFLNIETLALVVIDADSQFPSFNTATHIPELKSETRKAFNSALMNNEILSVNEIRTGDYNLKRWLEEAHVKTIIPLYIRGGLHSVILVAPRDEEISPTERRALRLLRALFATIIEGWIIEFETSESPDQESIRKVRRRLEQKLMEMETLYMVSNELATTIDLDKITPTLLVILVGQMGTDKALLFLEQPSGEFDIFQSKGLQKKQLKDLVLYKDKGVVRELSSSKSPLMLDILGMLHEGEMKEEVSRLLDLGISLVIPMYFQDKLIGIVGVGAKVNNREYTSDELKLLTALVNLSAVSVETARLFLAMKDTYSGVVKSLVNAIEAKDPYTRGHTERVTRYASVFGKSLKLNEDEMQVLMFGAVLHDVGYIGVSEDILRNPNGITSEERNELERHPDIGVSIIRKLPFMEESIGIVKSHHERYDGKGYPDSLKGDDIPYYARILAVCDAFDAMTSERRYRSARTLTEAARELERNARTQFDPKLVKTFLELIEYGRIKVIKGVKRG